MTDAAWMEEALRLATQAEAAGEVPVGAIVVCDEKIVGRGFNRNRAADARSPAFVPPRALQFGAERCVSG